MPNPGTGGAEVEEEEEEEDATGRGGPPLSELLTQKSHLSSARTRQTWRRRGKWRHDVETRHAVVEETFKSFIKGPVCRIYGDLLAEI